MRVVPALLWHTAVLNRNDRHSRPRVVMKFDVFLQCVRDEVNDVDSATARAFARDIALVVLGGRPSFMLDYGAGKLTRYLMRFAKRAGEIFSVDVADVVVIELEQTYFLSNLKMLEALRTEQVLFVDVDTDKPSILREGDSKRSSVDEAIHDILVKISRAPREQNTISLGSIVGLHESIAPPTVAGVLLGYPAAYVCERRSMSRAGSTLSACPLTLHVVQEKGKEDNGNDAVVVSGWTIPTTLYSSMDDDTGVWFGENVRAWECRVLHTAGTLGIASLEYKRMHKPGGHERVVF